MAEIKDPKRFYYAMRSKYMREAKQIGHKLSLATTEEEDAILWEKYNKIIKRWSELKIPEGVRGQSRSNLQARASCRPVFNKEYVELTMLLKELYAGISRAKTERERSTLEDEIRKLKKKRSLVTAYIDRETGEPAFPPNN